MKEKQTAICKPLLVILLLAIFVRLCWMMTQTPGIGTEGAEYARIAKNLLKGNGYVGNQEGPELMYAPLYPFLIAAISLMTGDYEIAGRLVSLILGTCLVLPVFFLALRIYGRRTALISASLVAFHPLLIVLSGSVYNESVYITLLMGGIYWGLRSLELENSKHSLLSGMCFGLAYLAWPFAIVYPFMTIFALFIVTVLKRKTLKRAALASLVLLIAFTVLAVPYITFLWSHTGQIRVEGKNNLNYTIGQRMNAGMTTSEAEYGIDENLREVGPLLHPDRFAGYSPYPKTLREILQFAFAMASRNKTILYSDILPSFTFGSPIILVLVIAGIFRNAWDYQRLVHEGFILLMLSFIVVLLLSAHMINFRYTFSLLPFLILWGSKGIEELSQWAISSAALVRGNSLPSTKHIGIAVLWLLTMLVLLFSIRGVPWRGFDDGPDSLPTKEAGLWLKKQMPGPKRIMDTTDLIPYYAGGTFVILPYAASSLLLRYIHHNNPDFIVLTGVMQRPIQQEWLQSGIPDGNAKLIYESANKQGEIMIYRWLNSERSKPVDF